MGGFRPPVHPYGSAHVILPGPLATAQAVVEVLSGLLLPCLSGELLLRVPGFKSCQNTLNNLLFGFWFIFTFSKQAFNESLDFLQPFIAS